MFLFFLFSNTENNEILRFNAHSAWCVVVAHYLSRFYLNIWALIVAVRGCLTRTNFAQSTDVELMYFLYIYMVRFVSVFWPWSTTMCRTRTVYQHEINTYQARARYSREMAINQMKSNRNGWHTIHFVWLENCAEECDRVLVSERVQMKAANGATELSNDTNIYSLAIIFVFRIWNS